MRSAPEREELRARTEITSHFAAGPQARWRGASDEQYPGRYVRSEQQSQRACGPQPAGARRRRARIGFVAAPRRCPTSTSSRRLASARPALAPKWEFISARALRPGEQWCRPRGAHSSNFQRALRIPSFALFEFLDGISIHLLRAFGTASPAEALLHAPPPRKSHGAAQAGILQDA